MILKAEEDFRVANELWLQLPFPSGLSQPHLYTRHSSQGLLLPAKLLLLYCSLVLKKPAPSVTSAGWTFYSGLLDIAITTAPAASLGTDAPVLALKEAGL